MYHIFSGIAVTEGVVSSAVVVVCKGGAGMGIMFSVTGKVDEGPKKMRTRAMRVMVLAIFNAECRFERNIRTTFGLWQLGKMKWKGRMRGIYPSHFEGELANMSNRVIG